MKIIVNGDARGRGGVRWPSCSTSSALAARWWPRRVNGELRPGRRSARTASSLKATASRCWRRCREARDAEVLRHGAELAAAARHGAVSRRRRSWREAVGASGAEVVTVSLRREAGGGAGGAGFWTHHPRARRASAAEHRRLPLREGSRHDRAHGARGVRHDLDQARSDRRPRHAAARRLRAGRGGPHPVRRTASRCFPTPPRTWSSPSGCSTPAARC